MITASAKIIQVDGCSNTENLGLQNIQARIRMVLAFMMASLMPWVHNKSGFYLVLGSSNVDEGLRGYLTLFFCVGSIFDEIYGRLVFLDRG
jgi:NAD+ synthase (glutamine-hydrolysing)